MTITASAGNLPVRGAEPAKRERGEARESSPPLGLPFRNASHAQRGIVSMGEKGQQGRSCGTI